MALQSFAALRSTGPATSLTSLKTSLSFFSVLENYLPFPKHVAMEEKRPEVKVLVIGCLTLLEDM
jgi:hypothetical protein